MECRAYRDNWTKRSLNDKCNGIELICPIHDRYRKKRGTNNGKEAKARGVKHDEITFRTNRSVNEIGRILKEVLVDRLKASSIDQVSSGAGVLGAFEDHADIEIVARGVDFASLWAVQAYVVDEGDSRAVTLVALGDGTLLRVTASTCNSASLTKSIRKRNVIADALR